MGLILPPRIVTFRSSVFPTINDDSANCRHVRLDLPSAVLRASQPVLPAVFAPAGCAHTWATSHSAVARGR